MEMYPTCTSNVYNSQPASPKQQSAQIQNLNWYMAHAKYKVNTPMVSYHLKGLKKDDIKIQ